MTQIYVTDANTGAPTAAYTTAAPEYTHDNLDSIYQMLDTTGDGSGTTEMATTSAVYKITPPSTKIYVLERMNIYIEEDGKFRGEWYGATKALTNGIVVSLDVAAGPFKTLTPQPIKVLGHWALQAGIDMYITNYATGNDTAFVRWTFGRSGRPVVLDGSAGQFLKFNVQDSLGSGGAALVSHLVQVQGYQVNVS